MLFLTKSLSKHIIAVAAFCVVFVLVAAPARALMYQYDQTDVAAIRIIADQAGLDEIKAWTSSDPGLWQNGPDMQEIAWSAGGRVGTLDMNSSQLAGVIDVTPLDGLVNLNLVWNHELTGITGLGALTELETLYIEYTGLGVLDVTDNTKLTDLSLYSTNVSVLDISKNTMLTDLNVADTGITALDISKNTRLAWLDISDTGISGLDLSQNGAISYLNAGGANRPMTTTVKI